MNTPAPCQWIAKYQRGSRAIAAGVLGVLWLMAAPASAGPPSSGGDQEETRDGTSTISALRIEEDDEGSYLRLEIDETPSFSVFKLQNPLRLVLDVSNSTLTADAGARDVENGAISRVALSTHKEEGRARVRLIVGFQRVSHYDVRTQDNDIVVFVENRGTSSNNSNARAELEETLQQKESKLTDIQSKYDRASSKLQNVRSNLDQARDEVQTLKDKLESSKIAAERKDELREQLESRTARMQSLETRLDKRSSRVDELRSELEGLKQERDRARTRLDELKDKLADERERATRKENKLEQLRRERKQRTRKLDSLEQERKQAQARLDTLEEKLEAERQEGQRKADKIEELQTLRRKSGEKLEQQRSKYQQSTSRLESTRSELESLRDELQTLREREQDSSGSQKKKLQAELQSKGETLEKLETTLAQRKQTADQLKTKVDNLREARRRAEKRIQNLRDELEAQKKRASRERQKLRNKQREARQRVEQLEKKLTEQRRRAERKRKQLQERLETRESEIRNKEETLEKTRQRVEKTRSKLETYREKLDERESEVASLETRVQQLQNEQERRSGEAKRRAADKIETLERKLQRKREQLQKRREKRESKIRAQEETLDEMRQRVEETRSKLETYREKLDERESEVASLETRVQTLKDEREKQSGRAKRQASDKIETLERKLQRKRKQRRDKLADLQEKHETTQKRLEDVRQQLRQKKDKLADLEQPSSESQPDDGPTARAVPMQRDETNTIQDIRLETQDGESRIIVELERPGQYKRQPRKESRAVMLLNNVELPDYLDQKITANGESGAVQFVSSHSESDDQVRMEAELASQAREQISQDGDKLVWEFAPQASQQASEASASRSQGNSTASSSPPPQADGRDDRPAEQASDRSSGSKPRAPDRSGPVPSAPPSDTTSPRTVTDPSKIDRVPGMARTEVTMDFRDADIQNVLRLFAKQGGVNIIAGDAVQGTITLRLRSVPLDQAFLIVLQSLKLGFEMRGDVIRVATQDQLLKEQKARQKARQRQQKLRPLEVFLMPISYASADSMVEQVQRLLSPRGSVSVDDRTNTLIIKDLPENIRSVRELVGALDTQVPQVLIEARIVETNDTFSQEFGVQWGGDFTMSQGNGNPTGLAFPNVLGVGGGATDGQTPTGGTSESPNFAVNLPAAAGTGAGGALGLTMGSISGNVNLNLRLSAAEESGHAKIVSAPKVLTLDNREATISQGTSIPISVVSAAGVQTVFVDATLELTVTPQVTPDGNVQMEITATKNEPDFQNTGARGDPTIIRKSAETELLVGDGETTVIGGIYTRNSGSSVTGIPILHQIPILGSLFKQTGRTERRSELLIFITPRVVNRAEALGGVSAGDVVGQGSSLGSSPSSGETGSGEGRGGGEGQTTQ